MFHIYVYFIYMRNAFVHVSMLCLYSMFFLGIYIYIPSQYDFRFAYIVPTSFPVIMTKFTLSSLSFLVWAHILQSKRKLPALPNR